MVLNMRKVIGKRVFDTSTARLICKVSSRTHPGEFSWEDTSLYLSPKGQWFLAGKGNAYSRWGRECVGGGFIPGDGVCLISEDEACNVLEAEGLDSLIEQFFKLEVG